MLALQRQLEAAPPLGANCSHLLSLLDMLRFYADKFHTATHMMAMLRSRLEQDSRDNIAISPPPTEMLMYLGELSGILGELNLPLSKKNVDFIREKLNSNPVVTKELRFAVEHLYRMLNDEISFVTFFSVKPEAAKLYEQPEPLFGADTEAAFPSSTFDVRESGKCLALDRHTACVMHLMRALETPLQAMARELGLSLKRDSWGNALQEIEKTIAALNPKTDADRKKFFSQTAVQFRFFKEAWRDASMHARSKYVDEEAQDIFRAVKSFMRQLATRLKEKTDEASEG